jgi:hypothetical protein
MPGSFPIGRVGVFVLSDTLCHKQAMFAQCLYHSSVTEGRSSGDCVVYWALLSRQYLIFSGSILFQQRRRAMRVVNPVRLLAVCVVTFLVVIGCGRKEAPKGRVSFAEPKDGAEIKGPVKVVMRVEGMKIQPAGEVVEGTGHHHILINKDFFPPGQVIPTDDTHRHWGKGDTEAVLDLPPGDYKLTLQFADGLHRSYGKDLSATINIKVASK